MSLGAFNNESKLNKVFTFIRIHNENKTENINMTNSSLNYMIDKEINYHFPVEQIFRIKISKKDENYMKGYLFIEPYCEFLTCIFYNYKIYFMIDNNTFRQNIEFILFDISSFFNSS